MSFYHRLLSGEDEPEALSFQIDLIGTISTDVKQGTNSNREDQVLIAIFLDLRGGVEHNRVDP